jgi:hypothetical protein
MSILFQTILLGINLTLLIVNVYLLRKNKKLNTPKASSKQLLKG